MSDGVTYEYDENGTKKAVVKTRAGIRRRFDQQDKYGRWFTIVDGSRQFAPVVDDVADGSTEETRAAVRDTKAHVEFGKPWKQVTGVDLAKREKAMEKAWKAKQGEPVPLPEPGAPVTDHQAEDYGERRRAPLYPKFPSRPLMGVGYLSPIALKRQRVLHRVEPRYTNQASDSPFVSHSATPRDERLGPRNAAEPLRNQNYFQGISSPVTVRGTRVYGHEQQGAIDAPPSRQFALVPQGAATVVGLSSTYYGGGHVDYPEGEDPFSLLEARKATLSPEEYARERDRLSLELTAPRYSGVYTQKKANKFKSGADGGPTASLAIQRAERSMAHQARAEGRDYDRTVPPELEADPPAVDSFPEKNAYLPDKAARDAYYATIKAQTSGVTAAAQGLTSIEHRMDRIVEAAGFARPVTGTKTLPAVAAYTMSPGQSASIPEGTAFAEGSDNPLLMRSSSMPVALRTIAYPESEAWQGGQHVPAVPAQEVAVRADAAGVPTRPEIPESMQGMLAPYFEQAGFALARSTLAGAGGSQTTSTMLRLAQSLGQRYGATGYDYVGKLQEASQAVATRYPKTQELAKLAADRQLLSAEDIHRYKYEQGIRAEDALPHAALAELVATRLVLTDKLGSFLGPPDTLPTRDLLEQLSSRVRPALEKLEAARSVTLLGKVDTSETDTSADSDGGEGHEVFAEDAFQDGSHVTALADREHTQSALVNETDRQLQRSFGALDSALSAARAGNRVTGAYSSEFGVASVPQDIIETDREDFTVGAAMSDNPDAPSLTMIEREASGARETPTQIRTRFERSRRAQVAHLARVRSDGDISDRELSTEYDVSPDADPSTALAALGAESVERSVQSRFMAQGRFQPDPMTLFARQAEALTRDIPQSRKEAEMAGGMSFSLDAIAQMFVDSQYMYRDSPGQRSQRVYAVGDTAAGIIAHNPTDAPVFAGDTAMGEGLASLYHPSESEMESIFAQFNAKHPLPVTMTDQDRDKETVQRVQYFRQYNQDHPPVAEMTVDEQRQRSAHIFDQYTTQHPTSSEVSAQDDEARTHRMDRYIQAERARLITAQGASHASVPVRAVAPDATPLPTDPSELHAFLQAKRIKEVKASLPGDTVVSPETHSFDSVVLERFKSLYQTEGKGLRTRAELESTVAASALALEPSFAGHEDAQAQARAVARGTTMGPALPPSLESFISSTSSSQPAKYHQVFLRIGETATAQAEAPRQQGGAAPTLRDAITPVLATVFHQKAFSQARRKPVQSSIDMAPMDVDRTLQVPGDRQWMREVASLARASRPVNLDRRVTRAVMGRFGFTAAGSPEQRQRMDQMLADPAVTQQTRRRRIAVRDIQRTWEGTQDPRLRDLIARRMYNGEQEGGRVTHESRKQAETFIKGFATPAALAEHFESRIAREAIIRTGDVRRYASFGDGKGGLNVADPQTMTAEEFLRGVANQSAFIVGVGSEHGAVADSTKAAHAFVGRLALTLDPATVTPDKIEGKADAQVGRGKGFINADIGPRAKRREAATHAQSARYRRDPVNADADPVMQTNPDVFADPAVQKVMKTLKLTRRPRATQKETLATYAQTIKDPKLKEKFGRIQAYWKERAVRREERRISLDPSGGERTSVADYVRGAEQEIAPRRKRADGTIEPGGRFTEMRHERLVAARQAYTRSRGMGDVIWGHDKKVTPQQDSVLRRVMKEHRLTQKGSLQQAQRVSDLLEPTSPVMRDAKRHSDVQQHVEIIKALKTVQGYWAARNLGRGRKHIRDSRVQELRTYAQQGRGVLTFMNSEAKRTSLGSFIEANAALLSERAGGVSIPHSDLPGVYSRSRIRENFRRSLEGDEGTGQRPDTVQHVIERMHRLIGLHDEFMHGAQRDGEPVLTREMVTRVAEVMHARTDRVAASFDPATVRESQNDFIFSRDGKTVRDALGAGIGERDQGGFKTFNQTAESLYRIYQSKAFGNPGQLAIMHAPEAGLTIGNAGAGVGKTTAAIGYLSRLVRDAKRRPGQQPVGENATILARTFAKKAEQEIVRRLDKQMTKEDRALIDVQTVDADAFHIMANGGEYTRLVTPKQRNDATAAAMATAARETRISAIDPSMMTALIDRQVREGRTHDEYRGGNSDEDTLAAATMKHLHDTFWTQHTSDSGYAKVTATRLLGTPAYQKEYRVAETRGVFDELEDAAPIDRAFILARFGAGAMAIGDYAQNVNMFLGTDVGDAELTAGWRDRAFGNTTVNDPVVLSKSMRQGGALAAATGAMVGREATGRESEGTFTYTTYASHQAEVEGQIKILRDVIAAQRAGDVDMLDPRHGMSIGISAPAASTATGAPLGVQMILTELRKHDELKDNIIDLSDPQQAGQSTDGKIVVGTIHKQRAATYTMFMPMGMGTQIGTARDQLSSPRSDSVASVPEIQQALAEGSVAHMTGDGRARLQRNWMGYVATTRSNVIGASGTGAMSPALAPLKASLKAYRGTPRPSDFTIAEAVPTSRGGDAAVDASYMQAITEQARIIAATTERTEAMTKNVAQYLPTDLQIPHGTAAFMEERSRYVVNEQRRDPAFQAMYQSIRGNVPQQRNGANLPQVAVTWDEMSRMISGDMTALPRAHALGAYTVEGEEDGDRQYEVALLDHTRGVKAARATGMVVDFGMRDQQTAYQRASALSADEIKTTGFTAAALYAYNGQQHAPDRLNSFGVPTQFSTQRDKDTRPDLAYLNRFSVVQGPVAARSTRHMSADVLRQMAGTAYPPPSTRIEALSVPALKPTPALPVVRDTPVDRGTMQVDSRYLFTGDPGDSRNPWGGIAEKVRSNRYIPKPQELRGRMYATADRAAYDRTVAKGAVGFDLSGTPLGENKKDVVRIAGTGGFDALSLRQSESNLRTRALTAMGLQVAPQKLKDPLVHEEFVQKVEHERAKDLARPLLGETLGSKRNAILYAPETATELNELGGALGIGGTSGSQAFDAHLPGLHRTLQSSGLGTHVVGDDRHILSMIAPDGTTQDRHAMRLGMKALVDQRAMDVGKKLVVRTGAGVMDMDVAEHAMAMHKANDETKPAPALQIMLPTNLETYIRQYQVAPPMQSRLRAAIEYATSTEGKGGGVFINTAPVVYAEGLPTRTEADGSATRVLPYATLDRFRTDQQGMLVAHGGRMADEVATLWHGKEKNRYGTVLAQTQGLQMAHSLGVPVHNLLAKPVRSDPKQEALDPLPEPYAGTLTREQLTPMVMAGATASRMRAGGTSVLAPVGMEETAHKKAQETRFPPVDYHAASVFAMNYVHGGTYGRYLHEMRPDVVARGVADTMGAIRAGVRTSTTRWGEQDIVTMRQLAVGSMVTMRGQGKDTLQAQVTRAAYRNNPEDRTPAWMEQWSQREGWDVATGERGFFEHGNKGSWSFEYAYVAPGATPPLAVPAAQAPALVPAAQAPAPVPAAARQAPVAPPVARQAPVQASVPVAAHQAPTVVPQAPVHAVPLVDRPQNKEMAQFIRQAASMVPNVAKLAPGGVHLVGDEEALVEAQRRFGKDMTTGLRGWSDPSTGSVYIRDMTGAKQDPLLSQAQMGYTTLHELGHLALDNAQTGRAKASIDAEMSERRAVYATAQAQKEAERLGVAPKVFTAKDFPPKVVGPSGFTQAFQQVHAMLGKASLVMSKVYQGEERTHEAGADLFAQQFGGVRYGGDARTYAEVNPDFAARMTHVLNMGTVGMGRKDGGMFIGRSADAPIESPEDFVAKIRGTAAVDMVTERPATMGTEGRPMAEYPDHWDDIPIDETGYRSDESYGAGGRSSPQSTTPPWEDDGYLDSLGTVAPKASKVAAPPAPPKVAVAPKAPPKMAVLSAAPSSNAPKAASKVPAPPTVAVAPEAPPKMPAPALSAAPSKAPSMVAATPPWDDDDEYLASFGALVPKPPTAAASSQVLAPSKVSPKKAPGAAFADFAMDTSIPTVAISSSHQELLERTNQTRDHAKRLYDEATPQQRFVMDAGSHDRVGLNADAGTGKTFSLIGKVAGLMAGGVRPDQMSMVTFSNRATGEFRKAVTKPSGIGANVVGTHAATMNIRTANSLAQEVIRASRPEIAEEIYGTGFDSKAFKLLSSGSYTRARDKKSGKPFARTVDGESDQGHHPGDDVMLMHEVIHDFKQHVLTADQQTAFGGIEQIAHEQYSRGQFKDELGGIKTARYFRDQVNAMVGGRSDGVGRFGGEHLAMLAERAHAGESVTTDQVVVGQMAKEYHRRMAERSLVGQEESQLLAVRAVQHTGNTTKELTALRGQFEHTLVDEAADLSATQVKLVDSLSAGRGMTVAGDSKQRVFGWRGAVTNVFESFGIARVGKLTQNFRSGAGIIQAINTAFGTETEAVGPRSGGGEVSYDYIKPGQKKDGVPVWQAENERMTTDIMQRFHETDPAQHLELARTMLVAMPTHDRLNAMADVKNPESLASQLKGFGIGFVVRQNEDVLRQRALEHVDLTSVPEVDHPKADAYARTLKALKDAEEIRVGEDTRTGVEGALHPNTKGGQWKHVYAGGMTGEGAGQIVKRRGKDDADGIDDDSRAVQYTIASRAMEDLHMYGTGYQSAPLWQHAATTLGLDSTPRVPAAPPVSAVDHTTPGPGFIDPGGVAVHPVDDMVPSIHAKLPEIFKGGDVKAMNEVALRAVVGQVTANPLTMPEQRFLAQNPGMASVRSQIDAVHTHAQALGVPVSHMASALGHAPSPRSTSSVSHPSSAVSHPSSAVSHPSMGGHRATRTGSKAPVRTPAAPGVVASVDVPVAVPVDAHVDAPVRAARRSVSSVVAPVDVSAGTAWHGSRSRATKSRHAGVADRRFRATALKLSATEQALVEAQRQAHGDEAFLDMGTDKKPASPPLVSSAETRAHFAQLRDEAAENEDIRSYSRFDAAASSGLPIALRSSDWTHNDLPALPAEAVRQSPMMASDDWELPADVIPNRYEAMLSANEAFVAALTKDHKESPPAAVPVSLARRKPKSVRGQAKAAGTFEDFLSGLTGVTPDLSIDEFAATVAAHSGGVGAVVPAPSLAHDAATYEDFLSGLTGGTPAPSKDESGLLHDEFFAANTAFAAAIPVRSTDSVESRMERFARLRDEAADNDDLRGYDLNEMRASALTAPIPELDGIATHAVDPLVTTTPTPRRRDAKGRWMPAMKPRVAVRYPEEPVKGSYGLLQTSGTPLKFPPFDFEIAPFDVASSSVLPSAAASPALPDVAPVLPVEAVTAPPATVAPSALPSPGAVLPAVPVVATPPAPPVVAAPPALPVGVTKTPQSLALPAEAVTPPVAVPVVATPPAPPVVAVPPALPVVSPLAASSPLALPSILRQLRPVVANAAPVHVDATLLSVPYAFADEKEIDKNYAHAQKHLGTHFESIQEGLRAGMASSAIAQSAAVPQGVGPNLAYKFIEAMRLRLPAEATPSSAAPSALSVSHAIAVPSPSSALLSALPVVAAFHAPEVPPPAGAPVASVAPPAPPVVVALPAVPDVVVASHEVAGTPPAPLVVEASPALPVASPALASDASSPAVAASPPVPLHEAAIPALSALLRAKLQPSPAPAASLSSLQAKFKPVAVVAPPAPPVVRTALPVASPDGDSDGYAWLRAEDAGTPYAKQYAEGVGVTADEVAAFGRPPKSHDVYDRVRDHEAHDGVHVSSKGAPRRTIEHEAFAPLIGPTLPPPPPKLLSYRTPQASTRRSKPKHLWEAKEHGVMSSAVTPALGTSVAFPLHRLIERGSDPQVYYDQFAPGAKADPAAVSEEFTRLYEAKFGEAEDIDVGAEALAELQAQAHVNVTHAQKRAVASREFDSVIHEARRTGTLRMDAVTAKGQLAPSARAKVSALRDHARTQGYAVGAVTVTATGIESTLASRTAVTTKPVYRAEDIQSQVQHALTTQAVSGSSAHLDALTQTFGRHAVTGAAKTLGHVVAGRIAPKSDSALQQEARISKQLLGIGSGDTPLGLAEGQSREVDLQDLYKMRAGADGTLDDTSARILAQIQGIGTRGGFGMTHRVENGRVLGTVTAHVPVVPTPNEMRIQATRDHVAPPPFQKRLQRVRLQDDSVQAQHDSAQAAGAAQRIADDLRPGDVDLHRLYGMRAGKDGKLDAASVRTLTGLQAIAKNSGNTLEHRVENGRVVGRVEGTPVHVLNGEELGKKISEQLWAKMPAAVKDAKATEKDRHEALVSMPKLSKMEREQLASSPHLVEERKRLAAFAQQTSSDDSGKAALSTAETMRDKTDFDMTAHDPWKGSKKGGSDGGEGIGTTARSHAARQVVESVKHFSAAAESSYAQNLAVGTAYDKLVQRGSQITGMSPDAVKASTVRVQGVSEMELASVVPSIAVNRKAPPADLRAEALQMVQFAKLNGLDPETATRSLQGMGTWYGTSAPYVGNMIEGARTSTGGLATAQDMMEGLALASPLGPRTTESMAQNVASIQMLSNAGLKPDALAQVMQSMIDPDIVTATRMKTVQDTNLRASGMSQQDMDRQFTNQNYWQYQLESRQMAANVLTKPLELQQFRVEHGIDAQNRSTLGGTGTYTARAMGTTDPRTLGVDTLNFRMQQRNLEFEGRNLARQSTILDLNERVALKDLDLQRVQLATQEVGLGINKEQYGLATQQFAVTKASNRLEVQGDTLDLALLKQRATYAPEQTSLEIKKSTIEFAAQKRELNIEKRMMPLQGKQMDIEIQSTAANYRWQAEGVGFKRWYDTEMYGTIGSDRSYRASLAMQGGQMAMGRNTYTQDASYNQMTQKVASAPVMGLANEQFYAGITHQLSQLQYGRSAFRAEAGYNENVQYLKKQTAFYERQMAVEDKARAFNYRIADEQLALAKESYLVQKAMLELQKERLQGRISDAAQTIPIEERLLEIGHQLDLAQLAQMPARIAIEIAKLGLKGKGIALSEQATALDLKQMLVHIQESEKTLALQKDLLNLHADLLTLQTTTQRDELALQQANYGDQLAIQEKQAVLMGLKEKELEIQAALIEAEGYILDKLLVSRATAGTGMVGTSGGQVTDYVAYYKDLVTATQKAPDTEGYIDPETLKRVGTPQAGQALFDAVQNGDWDQARKLAEQAGTQQNAVAKNFDSARAGGAFNQDEFTAIQDAYRRAANDMAKNTTDVTNAMLAANGKMNELTGGVQGAAGQLNAGALLEFGLNIANLAIVFKAVSGAAGGAAAGAAGGGLWAALTSLGTAMLTLVLGPVGVFVTAVSGIYDIFMMFQSGGKLDAKNFWQNIAIGAQNILKENLGVGVGVDEQRRRFMDERLPVGPSNLERISFDPTTPLARSQANIANAIPGGSDVTPESWANDNFQKWLQADKARWDAWQAYQQELTRTPPTMPPTGPLQGPGLPGNPGGIPTGPLQGPGLPGNPTVPPPAPDPLAAYYALLTQARTPGTVGTGTVPGAGTGLSAYRLPGAAAVTPDITGLYRQAQAVATKSFVGGQYARDSVRMDDLARYATTYKDNPEIVAAVQAALQDYIRTHNSLALKATHTSISRGQIGAGGGTGTKAMETAWTTLWTKTLPKVVDAGQLVINKAVRSAITSAMGAFTGQLKASDFAKAWTPLWTKTLPDVVDKGQLLVNKAVRSVVTSSLGAFVGQLGVSDFTKAWTKLWEITLPDVITTKGIPAVTLALAAFAKLLTRPTGATGVGATAFTGLKSFAVGIRNVPVDQLALIHTGEAVLTVPEATAYRAAHHAVSYNVGATHDSLYEQMVRLTQRSSVTQPQYRASAPQTASGSSQTYTVTVNQTVTGEVSASTLQNLKAEMIDGIATAIEKLKKR